MVTETGPHTKFLPPPHPSHPRTPRAPDLQGGVDGVVDHAQRVHGHEDAAGHVVKAGLGDGSDGHRGVAMQGSILGCVCMGRSPIGDRGSQQRPVVGRVQDPLHVPRA